MIYLKVKQMRYKYRYGCNMKKQGKNKTKNQKTQLRGVGTMRVNTVPTKLFWWLIFFRAFLFSFPNTIVSKVLWNSTKFLFAVLQCVIFMLDK